MSLLVQELSLALVLATDSQRPAINLSWRIERNSPSVIRSHQGRREGQWVWRGKQASGKGGSSMGSWGRTAWESLWPACHEHEAGQGRRDAKWALHGLVGHGQSAGKETAPTQCGVRHCRASKDCGMSCQGGTECANQEVDWKGQH